MSQQWIFVRPNDVLLFRDNKPFNAQENFVARGHFPPNPQIVQGIVRTYSFLNGKPIGTTEDMGGLTVEGLYVAKDLGGGKMERYYPTPLDLLYDRAEARFSVMKVAGYTLELSNAPKGFRPLVKEADDDAKFSLKEASGWLSESQFKAYLKDSLTEGELLEHEHLFQTEERVGLGLDYTRRANKEGMFYHAEFTRPQDDVGLMIGIDYATPIFDKQGFLQMGGESRFGEYTRIDAPEALPQAKSGRLKIILLTPAYFTEGLLPTNGFANWVGEGANLVSTIAGKPQLISGWDMIKKAPKPLRHFVPAGSVFFFESAIWQDNPFTENAENASYVDMGFGRVALGTW